MQCRKVEGMDRELGRAASSSVERWPLSQVSILRGVGRHPDRRIMTDAWPECNSAIQLSALLGNASTANVDRVDTAKASEERRQRCDRQGN